MDTNTTTKAPSFTTLMLAAALFFGTGFAFGNFFDGTSTKTTPKDFGMLEMTSDGSKNPTTLLATTYTYEDVSIPETSMTTTYTYKTKEIYSGITT